MACKIEILEVVGNLPLLSVTVRGTAEDCNRVRVCLQCAAGAPPLIETAAVDGGEWSVSFPGAVEHGCDCGKPFHVRAECADDTAEPPCQGTCFAELEGELRCCKIEILNVVGSLPGPSVTVKGDGRRVRRGPGLSSMLCGDLRSPSIHRDNSRRRRGMVRHLH